MFPSIERVWALRHPKVLAKWESFIGKKYGAWTITGVRRVEKEPRYRFELLCDCGKTGVTATYHVMNGKSRSCKDCSLGKKAVGLYFSGEPIAGMNVKIT